MMADTERPPVAQMGADSRHRAREVALQMLYQAEVGRMGVRVIAQYAVLGPYDFVTVLEAPDNETVSRVSVELGARGSVQMMTMPAIPVDDFIARLASRPRRAGARRRR